LVVWALLLLLLAVLEVVMLLRIVEMVAQPEEQQV